MVIDILKIIALIIAIISIVVAIFRDDKNVLDDTNRRE